MRLLLDTHVFLWWLNNDRQLGADTRRAIEKPENTVFVSAATAWEIAVKRGSGKLEAPGDIVEWIEQSSFSGLPIAVEHAVAAAELPMHHSDPFDRVLVAQAQLEEMTLVSHDDAVHMY
jgi:PIN domain nuclease of toxin-antitoxin system